LFKHTWIHSATKQLVVSYWVRLNQLPSLVDNTNQYIVYTNLGTGKVRTLAHYRMGQRLWHKVLVAQRTGILINNSRTDIFQIKKNVKYIMIKTSIITHAMV